MPRIKKTVHKLQKKKYSYNVNLPIKIIRELDWVETQKLVIRKSGNKIIIEDWKK